MPTAKPRVIVTLDPQDYELVRRVAKAQGSSMAALLREYVEMSRPMLEHLAALADSLERAQEERREHHQEAVERAMAKGQAIYDALGGQAALFLDGVEHLTAVVNDEGIPIGEATGDDSGAVDGGNREGPPTCNTGVRSQNKGNGGRGSAAA